jgi:TPR repeat protein
VIGSRRCVTLALAGALAGLPATRIALADDQSRVAEGISLYDRGRFVEAAAMLGPEAEAGSTAAQFHLGLMHARGEGTPRDLAMAAIWMERAAEGGHNHAQYIAGHMHAKGDGVPRDRARAHMWFTAATENGWWKAREARERLVDEGMTPREVTEAGNLLRAWRARRSEGGAR